MTGVLQTADLGQILTFWIGCYVIGYVSGQVQRWFQAIGEKL